MGPHGVGIMGIGKYLKSNNWGLEQMGLGWKSEYKKIVEDNLGRLTTCDCQ